MCGDYVAICPFPNDGIITFTNGVKQFRRVWFQLCLSDRHRLCVGRQCFVKDHKIGKELQKPLRNPPLWSLWASRRAGRQALGLKAGPRFKDNKPSKKGAKVADSLVYSLKRCVLGGACNGFTSFGMKFCQDRNVGLELHNCPPSVILLHTCNFWGVA